MMNWIAPITDEHTLTEFENQLKNIDIKYYIMFMIGINTGLMMQDILQLKVIDMKGKDRLTASIGATKAEQTFVFPEDFKALLYDFTKDKDDEEFLFTGYNGDTKPMSRTQAYRVFKQAGEAVGIASIGVQTMRKTWAWNYYKDTGDIHALQKILSHASPTITYRYIGVMPNLETTLEKQTAGENERCRYELLKNNRGMKRISALMDLLVSLSDELKDPQMPDSWYGRADSLLTQMETLKDVFEKEEKQ